MQQKEIILVNKGMNRDLSVSKVDGSAAYDNRNIRLIATDKDTLLSVTNERGNKKVDNISFAGTLVGYGVLNDYILLFTVENTKDEEGQAKSVSYIYRVKYENDSFSSIVIFAGSLGFSTSNPIETIVDYETEDIQKIYWIDGLHVLRFLNFSDAYLTKHLVQGYTLEDPKFDFADNTTWFDSTRTSTVIPTVKITKDNAGNTRANGVAQYFITYYNKNGQQTGIVYSSPLVYLAPEGRGGAADQTNTNSVTVSVSDLDETFENVRLYNIIRTSLDGQVTGNIVGESSIVNGTATFVDDGAHYTSVDPTSFLFLGSSEARFGTMTQKDGTLFLGNIQSAGNEGVDNIEEAIKATAFILSGKDFTPGTDWESNIVEFVYSDTKSTSSETCHIPYVKAEGYYPYESQLNYTSKQITTFKGGEKYRFALRFVRSNGVQSKAFWIGDKVNPYYPKMLSDGYVKRAIAKCYVPELVIEAAQKAGYSSVKLMIAQATYADRSVKAQGIVCPTVFNLYDRTAGKIYARSSWFYRMRNGRLSSTHFSVLGNSNTASGEIQCNWWKSKKTSSTDTDTMATPSPLYSLDSNGGVVNPPAALKKYKAIEITISIERVAWILSFGYRNFYFYCHFYYEMSDNDPAYTYTSWVKNISRGDLPTYWAQCEEGAGVPAALRTPSATMEEYAKSLGISDKIILKKTSIASESNLPLRFATAERQYHFVDENIVTLNSPELSNEAVSIDNSSLSFRITGIAEMTAGTADYDITTENAEYSGDNVDDYLFTAANISQTDSTLAAWPLYNEFGCKKNSEGTWEKDDTTTLHYMIYPWHKSNSIPNFGTSEKLWSTLQTKRFANLHFAYYTLYNNYDEGAWSVTPSSIRQLTKQSTSLYTLKTGNTTVSVAGGADDVVLVPEDFKYPVYYSKDFADGFPNLPTLTYTEEKESSDSVRLTYVEDAQAMVALPSNNVSHTLLPRLAAEEPISVEIEGGNTGPFIPWQALYAGSKLKLYRILDINNPDFSDLTQGVYSGFSELNTKGDTLTALSTESDYKKTTCRDLVWMRNRVASKYNSAVVYVLLKSSNASGTETTRLVDISSLTLNSVTISVARDMPARYRCSFTMNASVPIATVSIKFYKKGTTTLVTEYAADANSKKIDTIRCFLDTTEVDIYIKLSFGVTYYDSDTKERVSVLPDFETTIKYDAASVYATYTDTIPHYAYLLNAKFIALDVTPTADYNFINLAETPEHAVVFNTNKEFKDNGIANGIYNVNQDVFTLTDSSLFTESMPYMFIGELYKDFDALAEQNPALDTRYGGISENAVENNTFVDAGSVVSLDKRSTVENFKTTEISGALIKQAILNNQKGLTFVFKLLGKEISGEGASTIAKVTCTSLSTYKLSDLLPTSSAPITGLTVEYESGSGFSKIEGLDELEIEAIRRSSVYKILVLRYGYARPGKKRYYTAKNTGVEQWSHTSRKAEYKTQRGGKCYRIIGHDLLYSGKTQAQQIYSQTWKEDNSAKYSTSTLVSSLGDELVLPAVRSSKTLKGRWSQNNRTGLVDLYIGLYHREG